MKFRPTIPAFLLWFMLGLLGFSALQTLREEETSTAHYYPLLGDAFLHGQTNLRMAVPPALAALSNPYSPEQSKVVHEGYGLFDMSYRNGKLYLYFGPTPALVAFAPYQALTHRHLSQGAAILFLCALGFAAGACLLGLAGAELGTPRKIQLPLQLSFGLLSGALILVRRPEVYEVAVASGFAFSALTLLFCARSLLGRGAVAWNLALAGLCTALATGSRPLLLPGLCLVLAGTAYHLFRYSEGPLPRRLSRLSPAFASLGLGLLALVAYNVVRFGKPGEFGLSYQVGGNPMLGHRMLSPQLLAYNLPTFLWQPPEIDRCYPFLFMPDPQSLPQLDSSFIHYANEGVQGLMLVCPLLLAAVPLALLVRGQGWVTSPALRLLFMLVGLLGCANLLIIGSFAWIAPRYQLEFQPWLVLLGLLLVLPLHAQRPTGLQLPPVPLWARRLAWLSFSASVVLSYLQSAGYALYVSSERSAEVRKPATLINPVLTRLIGPSPGVYGPWHLRLPVAAREAGVNEPLLTWIQEAKTKGFFLHHEGDGRGRIQYRVDDHLLAESAPFELGKPAPHEFEFLAGALLPRSTDPRLLGLTAEQASTLLSRVMASLDGHVILDTQLPRSTSPAHRFFVLGAPVSRQ